MRRLLGAGAVIVSLLAMTVLPALPAAAAPGGGGSGDGKNFSVYVKNLVHVKGSGYKGGGTRVPVDYDPPHCWYQPEYTYDEMLEWVRRIRFSWMHQGPEEQRPALDWFEETMAEVVKHAGEPGKIFWFLAEDGTDAGWDCYVSTDPFWIYVGAEPPQVAGDKIIDPVDLARIARANLTLPEPVIKVNPPGGRSFVALETWVGVTRPAPLDVTAYVEGFPALSAQIVATPLSVTFDTHGAEAERHISRNCPSYVVGMKPSQGCWLRFAKSSLGSAYHVTVTQTWRIDTNVAGVNFANAPMSTDFAVTVDEIQSNVTG